VIRKIRKACRAGGPAWIGQARIKPAGQPTKQIPEPDRAHQSAAGSAHECGIRQEENNGDLAELVWKYFGDEITEGIIEVQEAFAPEQGRLKKAGK
jgi:hypothetical protein